MLNRITIKALKTRKTRSGGAYWSAIVCLDGAQVAFVEQTGNGGCCTFIPMTAGGHAEMTVFLKAANAAAFEALGESSTADSAIEDLLSCMEMGMTAEDAIPEWKAAWGE